MSLVLETKRLKMRAFQDRDIEGFAEYRSGPDVARDQDRDWHEARGSFCRKYLVQE